MNCHRCLQIDGKEEICYACPVYLIEKDGSITDVCFVSRCVSCGWIAHYGSKFLYKLTGNVKDFGIEYWPELRRNEIAPDAFERAIFNIPTDRILRVDARKNFEFDLALDPTPSEKFKDYVNRFFDECGLFKKGTKEAVMKFINNK